MLLCRTDDGKEIKYDDFFGDEDEEGEGGEEEEEEEDEDEGRGWGDSLMEQGKAGRPGQSNGRRWLMCGVGVVWAVR